MCHHPASMAGGWVGYIYVFLACGTVVFFIGAATGLLYLRAKYSKKSPGARVVSVIDERQGESSSK